MIEQYLPQTNENATVAKSKKKFTSRALFSSQNILQNFSDYPSHQIFRRMHEVLNIDENKN